MRTPPRIFLAPDNHVSADVDAGLKDLVRTLSARSGLHHVNLAVADDEGRSWSGAAGPTDEEPQIRPSTPFFIASITKRFIITLLLQAYERDEVDLDAPITAYLPGSVVTGLHVRAGVDRSGEITVRHLASHTSGLPDFFERRRGAPSLFKQLRAGQDTSWDFDDVLDITRNQQRPHFDPQDLGAPRQRARYSDTGFQLLIRILESVTARSFSDLLAERITAPLGLDRTWHPAGRPAVPDLSAPEPLHTRRSRVAVDGVIASSNDLISTTGDLLTFERALVAGHPFRDPGTRHLLTERANRLRNAPGLRYGLGTMIFKVNRLVSPSRTPVTLVGHSGSTGTWLFTSAEFGVHLAGTVDQTQAQALPFHIMARCLRIWARA